MLTKINKYIVFFIYFFISSNLLSEDLLEAKEDYRLAISEIVQILNKNHFKKNIEITHKKVIDNFLRNLDKEKIIFTSSEFNSNSLPFKDIYNLNEIFNIYENYHQRSLLLISHQQDVVNLIGSSKELNTTEFINRSREEEQRFNSLEDIKNYHALLIKNEFINILLSNDDFLNSKSKLLKRLKNRAKSLKRIKSDDIFSLYMNSITSLYDPHKHESFVRGHRSYSLY